MIRKTYYTDQHGRIFGERTTITTLYIDPKTEKIEKRRTVIYPFKGRGSKLESKEEA